MTLELEWVTDRDRLSAVRDEWQALADAAPRPNLFQTYEWVVSWIDAFWAGRPIHFAFVREEGTLRAVVPLVWDEGGDIRCPRSLAVTANAHSSGFDILSDADPAEVLGLIADAVAPEAPPRMVLRGLHVDSAVIDATRSRGDNGALHTVARPSLRAPFVDLRGSWEDYLASRDQRTRHKIRRNERRVLDAEGRFETVTDEADLPRALDAVATIERGSWKEAAGQSITAEDGAETLYRRLMERAYRRGWGRIHLLYIRGEPVAHVLGVVYRNRYYPFKTSFHAQHAGRSPGSVLVMYAIRDAFAEGYDTFEFLGMDEYFKRKLANGCREQVDLCVFAGALPRCLACAWREGVAKPFVRSRMPWLIDLKRRLRSS